MLAAELSAESSAELHFLPEAIEDAAEIWLAFERHRGTGQVALRQRAIKAIAAGGREGTLLVAQSRSGQLEAFAAMPADQVQQQRVGKLLYSRGKK